ncbi:MAG: NAD(P)H-dependent oxidoreductase [Bacteroidota bacterium]
MNILHINSSIRKEGSVSRSLCELTLGMISDIHPAEIEYIDLSELPLPPLDQEFVTALKTTPETLNQEQLIRISWSSRFISHMKKADLLLFGVPMYNFGVPSQLKTFFDYTVISGKTFVSDQNGDRGLLDSKKALVISSYGGLYSSTDSESMNHVAPYLDTILRFIGIQHITFVEVQPTLYYGPEEKAKAISSATEQLKHIVNNWIPGGLS